MSAMQALTRRICLIAFALAFAAAGSTAQAQPKTEVRVAMLAPSALIWLHAIAKDQGFYAERNIEVKELVAATSPALLQAVSSGSVEAGIAVADLAIRAIDQGAPVIMAGAFLNKSILRLIGAPGITDVKQLAGKPVTAGGVEGGTANLLRHLIKRNGGDPRGVQMVAIANSRDRIVAMGNGQVQGALLIAPFDTMAQRQTMKVIDDYREDYTQTPLVLNKEWAAKNRSAAEGLTRALQKAANWIYDPANKQKAISILADFTKTDADICADSYKFIVEEQKAIGRNFEITADGLLNLVKIDQDIGATPMSSRAFELGRYYDSSFLAK
jgi:ABC-type nitrate/sulfonate/bicarbonate transport system substrate-binding protein